MCIRDRILWKPEATDRSPEPQTWLTIYAGFSFGIPEWIEACLAGFCPMPLVSTCPIMISSISSLFNLDLFIDPDITAEPRWWLGTFFKLLLSEPTAVLIADVITTEFLDTMHNIDVWPLITILSLIFDINAPVAQLDRALGYGPGGSGFKS